MEPLKMRVLVLAWIAWMGTPLSGQDEDCRASGILSFAASPPPLPGREYHIEPGEVFQFILEARLETHFEGVVPHSDIGRPFKGLLGNI